MRSRLLRWVPALLLTIAVAVTGCHAATEPEEEPAADPAVTVDVGDGSEPARITLTEAAEQRLGITTKPVLAGPAAAGKGSTLLIPYSAVVYDADGKAWAFASAATRTYQRRPLVVASITNDLVTLSQGPKAGTELVVVGAPELVGAEAGISGEE